MISTPAAVGIPAITTRRLSSALGVEISGLDLNDFTEAYGQLIEDLWHKHLVILFRNQELTEEGQVAFGQHFGGGALSGGHNRALESQNAGVAYVTNVVEKAAPVGILPHGEMQFHSDQCHQEKPSKGTMLYALEVPSKGGNTCFANAYLAYETLPEDVKQRIGHLRALNIYDYSLNPTQRGVAGDGVPSWVHPIVRTHPATGRKALYVNRLMTARIEGLPETESDALLDYLFEHQENPQFIYEHIWQTGDAVMWDNRCTLHARIDFDPGERRRMRRITLPREAVD